MIVRALTAALALLAAAGPASGQRHAKLISRIDSLANETLRRSPAPGLSLAVSRGKETILARGYGFARLADSTRATGQTVYPIASITKHLTAVAILKLAEQKRVRLNDPIGRYLPGFRVGKDPVTIRHLLNHTSGFPALDELDGAAVSDQPVDPERVVAYLRNAGAPFKPGERFAYRNSGYFLLGAIIEVVSGAPYRDFLHDSLLVPLGLHSTGECSGSADSIAIGYEIEDSLFHPVQNTVPVPGFAAGGLCSTVDDLVSWERAVGDRKVVNNLSWHQMIEPAELNDGSRAGYGLGVTVGRLDKHAVVGHGGATQGFSSQLSYFPDDRVTVVVLANSGQALTRRLADQVARLVLGVPEPNVKDLAVDAAEAAGYAGSYRLQGDSTRIVIRFRQGRLEAQLGDGESFRLLYQGNREFAAEADPTTRLFFRTRSGPARSLEFRSGDLVLLGTRVEN